MTAVWKVGVEGCRYSECCVVRGNAYRCACDVGSLDGWNFGMLTMEIDHMSAACATPIERCPMPARMVAMSQEYGAWTPMRV